MKKLSILFFFLVLPFLAIAQAPLMRVYYVPKALPENPADFHIFILAGQSNMAGRGVVKYENRELHPRVLEWQGIRKNRWYPAIDPFTRGMYHHKDKSIRYGVSMAQEFLRLYAEDHPGVMVGCILRAVGGSDLRKNWVPGNKFVALAMDDIKAAAAWGTIKGMLWHQGENDLVGGLTEGYQEKLVDLFTFFRKEIGCDFPIILGELPAFKRNLRDKPEDFKRINADMHEAAAKIGKAAVASAEGLKPREDNIHIDTESQIEFGKRYYEAWKQLERAGK